MIPHASEKLARVIPEYDLLYIHLATLPDEVMDALNQYGTLKAIFLAMKHIRNKRFLKRHFEEIFVFLQEHPEKNDLRDQLITYVLGKSEFTQEEFAELLKNILSSTLKEKVMATGVSFIAVAGREGAEKAKAAAEKKAKKVAEKAKLEIEKVKAEKEAAEEDSRLKTRLFLMIGWNKGVDKDTLVAMSNLTSTEIHDLIEMFEKIKNEYEMKPTVDFNALMELSGFNKAELNAFLQLLKRGTALIDGKIRLI